MALANPSIRVKLLGWVDPRKPNNFPEYFHNLGWVSPFDPIGNTCSIMIAQSNPRLERLREC